MRRVGAYSPSFHVLMLATLALVAACNDESLSGLGFPDEAVVEAPPPSEEPAGPAADAEVTPVPDVAAPTPTPPPGVTTCAMQFAGEAKVPSTLSMTNLRLATDQVPFQVAIDYAVTVRNSGALAVTGGVLQAYIEQSQASCAAAGGRQVDITSTLGLIPPGTHETGYKFNASNADQIDKIGLLAPGPALVRIRLEGSNGLLDELILPITIVP